MNAGLADAAAEAPSHVPPPLVRDFDLFHFSAPTADLYDECSRISREEPAVFFTPHHGGYWVVNRADLLEQAYADWELFSSEKSVGGAGVPPSPAEIPAFLPVEIDGAMHSELRRPLNLALSPRRVQELSVTARALAVRLIEGLAPRGRCEFVNDFSLKMPMELFLRLVDLPLEDLDYLLKVNQDFLRHPDISRRHAAQGELTAYLDGWVRKRVAEPGHDLMSNIVHLQVEGRPLTHEERVGYMGTVLAGGLDTVGGAMAMSARHLATHPEHRRHLIDNPGAIPNAVDELLRRHSSPTFGRYVVRDVEFGGVSMKRGDRIMLPLMLHGMDERRWDKAREVQLGRSTRGHMAFAAGPHRCPGANLARVELAIFLEEWLKRIPDFAIDPEGQVLFEMGSVVGLKTLPLVWQAA